MSARIRTSLMCCSPNGRHADEGDGDSAYYRELLAGILSRTLSKKELVNGIFTLGQIHPPKTTRRSAEQRLCDWSSSTRHRPINIDCQSRLAARPTGEQARVKNVDSLTARRTPRRPSPRRRPGN